MVKGKGNDVFGLVTSYAEVWIEIVFVQKLFRVICGHLLRGGVD